MLRLFLKILVCCLFAQVSMAGHDVGNGGGFALCNDRKYYSYDYIISLNHTFGPNKYNLDFNQRIQFILAHLKRLNDPMVKDLEGFMAILYTQTPGKKFQWFRESPLPMLWDPDLARRLPSGCQTRKQAVYFFPPIKNDNTVRYNYDPALLAQVQAQPLGGEQIAYLWIHEWLWNYFSPENYVNLAYFNRLLNSDKLETISPAEYVKLKNSLLK